MELKGTGEDQAQYAEFRITLTAESAKSFATTQYRTDAVGYDGRPVSGLFMNPLSSWMVDVALSSVASAGKALQRSSSTDSLDPVRDLGARLYDALFSGSIERAFIQMLHERGAARVRLVLDDEEAMAIPWEFLYDRRRNDFLVLSTRTPLVRTVSRVDRPSAPPPLEAPVRVLVVASDVTGGWDVGGEIDLLRKSLGDSQYFDLITHTAATWDNFCEKFTSTRPDVLHLIATGAVSQQTAATPLGGQAVAFLTDAGRPVTKGGSYSLHSAGDLRVLVQSNPRLRLLVLNGCRTDGVAASLARVVTGVIGHRGDPSDVSALAFADGLYSALTRGVSLDGAVTAARLEIDARTPGGREWCAPVLYQQNEVITFPAPAQVVAPELPGSKATVAPRQEAKASKDNRDLQKLNSLLAIQQMNLDALREQTRRLGDAMPEYLQQEIATTKGEIERLSEQITDAGATSGRD